MENVAVYDVLNEIGLSEVYYRYHFTTKNNETAHCDLMNNFQIFTNLFTYVYPMRNVLYFPRF